MVLEQKKYTYAHGTELTAQKKTHAYMVNSSMTKEVTIYNGENITSSINGVEKTGQLHAQESNWNPFSYHLKK